MGIFRAIVIITFWTYITFLLIVYANNIENGGEKNKMSRQMFECRKCSEMMSWTTIGDHKRECATYPRGILLQIFMWTFVLLKFLTQKTTFDQNLLNCHCFISVIIEIWVICFPGSFSFICTQLIIFQFILQLRSYCDPWPRKIRHRESEKLRVESFYYIMIIIIIRSIVDLLMLVF